MFGGFGCSRRLVPSKVLLSGGGKEKRRRNILHILSVPVQLKKKKIKLWVT